MVRLRRVAFFYLEEVYSSFFSFVLEFGYQIIEWNLDEVLVVLLSQIYVLLPTAVVSNYQVLYVVL